MFRGGQSIPLEMQPLSQSSRTSDTNDHPSSPNLVADPCSRRVVLTGSCRDDCRLRGKAPVTVGRSRTDGRVSSTQNSSTWRNSTEFGNLYSRDGMPSAVSTCGGLTRSTTISSSNLGGVTPQFFASGVFLQSVDTYIGELPAAEGSVEGHEVIPALLCAREPQDVVVIDENDPIWCDLLALGGGAESLEMTQNTVSRLMSMEAVPRLPLLPLTVEHMG
ncbi:uncharacterized protein TEOVI_000262500 [Trypanosoma equiperdum]|uniref:Uncharacterized protein n=4 Tax=Trypanozoon TaxID=39700 RepID=Q38D20_TRYB2|nr:T. brucei spp.-specific protein [Trypanosoma brucei gambiense DAL972]XP_827630.1 hypothetical protein Tb09.211.4900 [Trypanosoma brucei brucei TREU927]RHW70014.1 hypothetical protein DPX39_090087200 [Trypanosoma brucei equiperdum]SCU71045.1 hypothetical protein, conserved [Trypanosoma equiperdum]EAN77300.1 hypothetical protein Tb09.211.4900 [Trypanosoma brucei brucei TREU927]CBH14832.1 T. brucei spp.-specific protein [Trypanosoma brucei gambiense DAL972]|eukprot:XP_011777098.1 T. brucei spp.-specific protein [Trypanosoma brucei gambiense DAL972]